MGKGLTLIVVLFVVVSVCVFALNGCTDPNGAKRILDQQGYTDIEITGWRPFVASEDDTFSTGFRAKTVKGDAVTGAVCSGLLKGSTIRLD